MSKQIIPCDMVAPAKVVHRCPDDFDYEWDCPLCGARNENTFFGVSPQAPFCPVVCCDECGLAPRVEFKKAGKK